MLYAVLLSSAVVLNAGSSFFYKYSSLNDQNRPLSIALLSIGLGLGAVNAVLYTKSLKGIELNLAYPIFSAGTLVLVTALSLFVFREGISATRLAGIGILIAGVVVISL
jgi:Membrane transporters of cations and cationic drugs